MMNKIILSIVNSKSLFQIVVKNLNNTKDVYYFPCSNWLSKDEGDGQISRQLLGTRNLDNIADGKLFYSICLSCKVFVSF